MDIDIGKNLVKWW